MHTNLGRNISLVFLKLNSQKFAKFVFIGHVLVHNLYQELKKGFISVVHIFKINSANMRIGIFYTKLPPVLVHSVKLYKNKSLTACIKSPAREKVLPVTK